MKNSSVSQLLRLLVKESNNKEVLKLAVEASEEFREMQVATERARSEVAATKAEAAAALAEAKVDASVAKAEAGATKALLAKELKYSKAIYLRGFQVLVERNLRLELDDKNPGLLKRKRNILTGTIEPMCTRSELFDLVKRGFFPDLSNFMSKCGVDDVTKSSNDLYSTLSGITHSYYNNRFEDMGLEFLNLDDKDYYSTHEKCFSKNLIQYAVEKEMRVAIDPSKAWAAGTLILGHEINKVKMWQEKHFDQGHVPSKKTPRKRKVLDGEKVLSPVVEIKRL